MAVNLNQLNPRQREAVRVTAGPVLVLAGAGTGKTRVIAYRAAYLVEQGVKADSILAMTFTNKAAREMRERIGKLTRPDAAKAMTIGTFHAFGARLLRQHGGKLGINPAYDIATESYLSGLVRQLLQELGRMGGGFTPEEMRGRLSRVRNTLTTPEELRATAGSPQEVALAELWELYVRRLRQMDLLDFDDLLLLPLELWQRFPDLLATHRQRYRHLMVDEYQDTNAVQFQIVRNLAGREANLCAVGDDDQSIYGWRGADIANILHFEDSFPGAQVIRLEQNYRSTTTILNAANAVIARNPRRHGKTLWSELETGDKLLAVQAPDEEAEAKFVADLIQDWQLTRNLKLSDLAVLYRSNHQSRLLEAALRQARLPYVLVGGHSFFERKEILDGVSLIQAAHNPRHDLALLRILNVPPRGLGDAAVEHLRDLHRITGAPLRDLLVHDTFLDTLSPNVRAGVRAFHACLDRYATAFAAPGGLAAKVEGLFTDSGYLDGLVRLYKPREQALERRENLLEFINATAQFEERHAPRASLSDFLEQFALRDANDRTEKDGAGQDAVTLMTIHAAKGLEFPAVILVGLEHGLFPHEQSIGENRLDEERRLFYVAITRARRFLVLTYADKRRTHGTFARRRPSGFLEDLPKELVEFCSVANALAPASAAVADDYMAKLKAMFE